MLILEKPLGELSEGVQNTFKLLNNHSTLTLNFPFLLCCSLALVGQVALHRPLTYRNSRTHTLVGYKKKIKINLHHGS